MCGDSENLFGYASKCFFYFGVWIGRYFYGESVGLESKAACNIGGTTTVRCVVPEIPDYFSMADKRELDAE